jgi:hypothetical protein
MLRLTGRVVRYLVLPALAGAVWLALPSPPAEARPQYFEQFKKTYERLAEPADSRKCTVCHGMGKKTERNKYGQAISTALGDDKNVKDLKAVEKALRAAEPKPSGVESKTFGDLIKEGKLPE